MYIAARALYNGIMPITLTQLEDKVIAAAKANRPGDDKGIIRAVSFVMGTLIAPYGTASLSDTKFDHEFVADFIDADDEIDLAAFYDLAYLSLRVESLKYTYASRPDIGKATRMVIDGIPLSVAVHALSDSLESGVRYTERTPSSYWAPMNAYRFGEKFSFSRSSHIALASEAGRQELFKSPDVNASNLRALPKAELVKTLEEAGREDILFDVVSANESILQKQKQLFLGTKSTPKIFKFVAANPLFMTRFIYDEDLFNHAKKLAQKRKTAMALYFSAVCALGAFRFVGHNKSDSGPMREYLLDKKDIEGFLEAECRARLDLTHAFSALYLTSVIDSDARGIFGRRLTGIPSNASSFINSVTDETFKERSRVNKEELGVRGFDDARFEGAATFFDNAESFMDLLSPRIIVEMGDRLTEHVKSYDALELGRLSFERYANRYLAPRLSRAVLSRRIDELKENL